MRPWIALCGCLLYLPNVAEAGSTRLALLVGSNEGTSERPPLWFAESDAERLAAALVEVGTFRREDVTVLKRPSAETLAEGLRRLAAEARGALEKGVRPLVLFYYSGHADPGGLQLGSERLPYAEIRDILMSVPEGMRVAVLDACHSGALTQIKGASRAPLDFELPHETSASGLAVITSSSASEAAHESASLRSSFFTHHLTLGLRGAADSDGDGRVTLGESYRYAYHRTLATTAQSGVAPQHPTYALRMTGKGEVVLTDLRSAPSAVTFTAGAGRSYFMINDRTGEVVAEVSTRASPMRIGVPAGRYRLERIVPAPRLTGMIDVPPEGGIEVRDERLVPSAIALATRKGSIERSPDTFGFLELSGHSPVLRDFGPAYGLGLGLRRQFGSLSLAGGLRYATATDSVGLSHRLHLGTLALGAAYGAMGRHLGLLAGGEAGVSWAIQRLSKESDARTLIPHLGPRVALLLPLGRSVVVRFSVAGVLRSLRVQAAGEPHAERAFRGSLELAAAVETPLW